MTYRDHTCEVSVPTILYLPFKIISLFIFNYLLIDLSILLSLFFSPNKIHVKVADSLKENHECYWLIDWLQVIEPQFQRDFISLLPKELSLYVLCYLEPKDLLRYSLLTLFLYIFLSVLAPVLLFYCSLSFIKLLCMSLFGQINSVDMNWNYINRKILLLPSHLPVVFYS